MPKQHGGSRRRKYARDRKAWHMPDRPTHQVRYRPRPDPFDEYMGADDEPRHNEDLDRA